MALIDTEYIENRIRKQLLVQLTDDGDAKTGMFNLDKLNHAIFDAESKINNALRVFFLLPLQSDGNTDAYNDSITYLRDLELQLVMVLLYSRAGLEVPAEFANIYVDIDTIRTGAMQLHGFKMTTVENADYLPVYCNKAKSDTVYSKDLIGRI